MVYLKTNILENIMKPVKKIPYCHQTIQTEWSFLPNHKITLNNQEFMPNDLFWDVKTEDRIGILILGHFKFNFHQLIEEYCLENDLGNFSRFKKPKKQDAKKKQTAEEDAADQIKHAQMALNGSLMVDEGERFKPSDFDFTSQQKFLNTSQEAAEHTRVLISEGLGQNSKQNKKKKKSSKISWMFRKMAKITEIFNSKKDDEEMPDIDDDGSSDDSEPEYEEAGEDAYIGFNEHIETDADQEVDSPIKKNEANENNNHSFKPQASNVQPSEQSGDELSCNQDGPEAQKVAENGKLQIPINTNQRVKSVDECQSPTKVREFKDLEVKTSGLKQENLSDSGVLTTEQLNDLNGIESELESKQEEVKDDLSKAKSKGTETKRKSSSKLSSLFTAFSSKSKNKNPKDSTNGNAKEIPSPENLKSTKSVQSQAKIKKGKVNPAHPKPSEYFKNIIIHLHGGGFMAMSTSYHEVYLRSWANKLKHPVFSIDYRLAPLAKYPENLHDCIRAYFWILQFCEKVAKSKVENIVLIGDSAGGGLAAALTIWLIENKQRVPDSLNICYGCVGLQMKEFKPSFLYGLSEKLLHYSAMLAVHDQYLPDGVDEAKDYYISPVICPEKLLAQFPKTTFYTCMQDPLCDDQVRMAYRMQQLGCDVHINLFRYMQHGILTVSPKEFLAIKIFQDMVLNNLKDALRKAEESEPAQNELVEEENTVEKAEKDTPEENTEEKIIKNEKIVKEEVGEENKAEKELSSEKLQSEETNDTQKEPTDTEGIQTPEGEMTQ